MKKKKYSNFFFFFFFLDEKWHDEDSIILRVVESYCSSTAARYTQGKKFYRGKKNVAKKLKCLSLCPQSILVFNIEAYIKFFFFCKIKSLKKKNLL